MIKLIEKVATAVKSRITKEDLKLHNLNECCKLCLLCKGKRIIKRQIYGS